MGAGHGVGGGKILAALLLEDVAGAKAIAAETLELTFGIAHIVYDVSCRTTTILGPFFSG